jgi:hypothetical protein
MLPEIQTEFCLTGLKILPEEITNSLGVSPTRTWLVGDSIEGTLIQRKHNGWSLSTNLKRNLDLGESLQPLLQILLPKSKTINYMCTQYSLDAEISCAIYITDETPIINLDKNIIAQVADLSAEIDIDIILVK